MTVGYRRGWWEPWRRYSHQSSPHPPLLLGYNDDGCCCCCRHPPRCVVCVGFWRKMKTYKKTEFLIHSGNSFFFLLSVAFSYVYPDMCEQRLTWRNCVDWQARPNAVSVQVWSKSTGSLNRLQKKKKKKLIFTVLIVWWPWKPDQCLQNLINSFYYPNDKILIFTVLIVWWPWKPDQCLQNLINSFYYPNDKIQ